MRSHMAQGEARNAVQIVWVCFSCTNSTSDTSVQVAFHDLTAHFPTYGAKPGRSLTGFPNMRTDLFQIKFVRAQCSHIPIRSDHPAGRAKIAHSTVNLFDVGNRLAQLLLAEAPTFAYLAVQPERDPDSGTQPRVTPTRTYDIHQDLLMIHPKQR